MTLRALVLSTFLLNGCASGFGLVRLPNGYIAPLPVADAVLSGAASEVGASLVVDSAGFSLHTSYWSGTYVYSQEPAVLDGLCVRVDLNGDRRLTTAEYTRFAAQRDVLYDSFFHR